MRFRFVCLLPILLSLFPLLARAEEWRKAYIITGHPEISVDTNDGDIRVHVSDRKDIEAVVISMGEKIGPSGVQITENQTGNHVSLTVRERNHWGINFHRRSLRVELDVPREANLDLHSGDGNVRVFEVKGLVHAETGDGDIEATGTEGSLRAKTGDGNIRVDATCTELELHSGDGNITAQIRQGSKMDSRWIVGTGDGNIELRLPESFSAEVDAHTGDGHIDLDFPVTVNGSVRESTIRGKMNGGGQTLELRSGDGNISLRKV